MLHNDTSFLVIYSLILYFNKHLLCDREGVGSSGYKNKEGSDATLKHSASNEEGKWADVCDSVS